MINSKQPVNILITHILYICSFIYSFIHLFTPHCYLRFCCQTIRERERAGKVEEAVPRMN